MSGTAYAFFMCGLAAVFVIVKLTSFDAAEWISRDLKRGDLYSLIEVASGQRPDGLTPDQASRLEARGMVRRLGHGRFRATLKGRLALRIRQAVRRKSPAGGEAISVMQDAPARPRRADIVMEEAHHPTRPRSLGGRQAGFESAEAPREARSA